MSLACWPRSSCCSILTMLACCCQMLTMRMSICYCIELSRNDVIGIGFITLLRGTIDCACCMAAW
jgi:hypothetical protein